MLLNFIFPIKCIKYFKDRQVFGSCGPNFQKQIFAGRSFNYNVIFFSINKQLIYKNTFLSELHLVSTKQATKFQLKLY